MRARRRSTRRGARPSPPSSCDSTAMCSAPCRAMRSATTTTAPTRSWCCSMFSRIELWLAMVLAVAVVVAVFAGVRSPKPTPENEPPSTFLTGPGGSKALYDVLARLGQPVERRRTALFNLTRDEHRSEEHTSELQSRPHLVCRLLLEKKKNSRWAIPHATRESACRMKL